MRGSRSIAGRNLIPIFLVEISLGGILIHGNVVSSLIVARFVRFDPDGLDPNIPTPERSVIGEDRWLIRIGLRVRGERVWR